MAMAVVDTTQGRRRHAWRNRPRVVDAMEAWVEETGIDGFDLADAITPGTLRETPFGAGPRLAAPHPGAAYRRAAQRRPSVPSVQSRSVAVQTHA